MSAAVVKERFYDIIVSPVVTEKSQSVLEKNKVTFRVAVDATKPEIKAAVEAVFGVKVKSVNVLNRLGKIKLFRGRKGQRKDTRLAIVTLAEGQQIDISASI